MSASLVGSEMCIRDRSCLARGSAACRPLRRLIHALALHREDVGRAAPVSYTHLTLPTICSV
eukprot:14030769-Alexandrium_andersonii.AAC.1